MTRLSVASTLTLALALSACASAPTCPEVAPKPPPPEKVNQLLDAKQRIEAMVLDAYERELLEFLQTGKEMTIHVVGVESNHAEQPALGSFIWRQTATYLHDNVKLAVEPQRSMTVDGVLEQYVVARRDAGGNLMEIELLAMLKDAKSGTVLASTIVPITEVPAETEYRTYAASYTPANRTQVQARLRVEAVNVGKGYETMEKVAMLERRYSSSSSAQARASGSYHGRRGSRSGSGRANVSGSRQGRSSTTAYRHRGTSGWYPMQQQLTINGTTYKLDRDDVFLDETIAPGTYDVEVSFREGFWDASTRRQVEGKKFRESFSVTIGRGQHLAVKVAFICDEERREIKILGRE